MITVVAALIHQDGRLLICQRRRDVALALKWEFPGGKVRPGEAPAGALERELGEELGVAAKIGREIYRTRHRYAEFAEELELVFFTASLPRCGDAPRNLAFEAVVWATPAELPGYDFLPADAELVALVASGTLEALQRGGAGFPRPAERGQ